MKIKERWYQIVSASCILALVTSINYSIYLAGKVDDLDKWVELANLRVKINNDWTDEVIFGHLNDIQGQTKDMLIEQGRLEGIVQLMDEDAYNDAATVWHEGYQRGLDQNEDLADMEYERGYHAAMKHAFPEHPVVITPRTVTEGAIKTPDFDESVGGTLPNNNEEVEAINKKVKELFKEEDN